MNMYLNFKKFAVLIFISIALYPLLTKINPKLVLSIALILFLFSYSIWKIYFDFDLIFLEFQAISTREGKSSQVYFVGYWGTRLRLFRSLCCFDYLACLLSPGVRAFIVGTRVDESS